MTRAATLSRLIFAERRVTPIRADRERTLVLPDGRKLGVAEFGERSAVPIVYLHGFLGSRLEPGAADGRTSGIVAFDRPGYGGSDLQPAPSLAAFGRDIAAGLDLLGIERCVLVGASAGAPYAVAAALALGPRVAKLVLAAGIGGPEVLLGAGGAARVIVRLAGRALAGRLLHGWFRLARRTGLDRTLLGIAISTEFASLARLGIETATVHERLLQSLRAGSDRWLRGVLADARLLTRPWDLDLSRLASGTVVIHGTADPAVPAAHAEWYAAHLPAPEIEMVRGQRHLSLCFASVATVERIAREAALQP
jgi:pimeloyl-ACP methyl ester carboxylesterase